MIRHIVLFKLIDFTSPDEKSVKLNEIKRGLEALINKIDVLRKIQVDFNVNPAENWDLILTTEFDSLESLAQYANHPEHIAVGKQFINPVKADRACVDYEF